MLGKGIVKKISILSASLCIFSLYSVKAEAKWNRERDGWVYKEGNSKAVGWRYIDNHWYYFSDSSSAKGIMQTGWNYVNGKWYYMDSDGVMLTGWIQNGPYWYYLKQNGEMAHDTTISGYKINSSGQWVPKKVKESDSSKNSSSNKDDSASGKNSSSSSKKDDSKKDIDVSEARALITKNDSKFISNKTSEGRYLEIEYAGSFSVYSLVNGKWDIKDEPCYEFTVIDKTDSSSEFDYCNYIVGRESGKVYAIPNQAGLSAYEISSNKIVKTYKWQMTSKSTGWR